MFSHQNNMRERRVGQPPMAPQHLMGMPQQGPGLIMPMPAQQMPMALPANHYPTQNSYSSQAQGNMTSYVPHQQVPLPQKSNYHQPPYNNPHSNPQVLMTKQTINRNKSYRKDFMDSRAYNMKEKNNFINKEYHTFSRYNYGRKNGYYSAPVQRNFVHRKPNKFNGHIPRHTIKDIHAEAHEGASVTRRSKSDECPAIPRALVGTTKEKTPMCLVNELARFNKITHQYRLTNEQGPAHKKSFTVTLTLGTEEYTAEGPSIKKAQHSAAAEALVKTLFPHPTPKTVKNQSGKPITPTVELNALAMKRGEPAIYKLLEPTQLPQLFHGPPFGLRKSYYGMPWIVNENGRRGYVIRNGHISLKPGYPQNIQFTVSLKVGSWEFFGVGMSPQSARHDAASKALSQLKMLPLPEENTCSAKRENAFDASQDVDSLVKSPISLVYEIALKRGLTVSFEVVNDRGPPHMKIFLTKCTVGTITAVGEGNGKKISKKRAAENMLNELKKLPPMSPTLNTNATAAIAKGRKRFSQSKKKSRNLVKTVQRSELANEDEVNPISRLIQIQQFKKEKEPSYTLVEERGTAKKKEFVIQVTAGKMSATGTGSNKKLAKKNAAQNLLSEMGYVKVDPLTKSAMKSTDGNAQDRNKDRKVTFVDADKPTENNGTGGSTGRQLKPGIYVMSPCDQQGSSLGETVCPAVNIETTAIIAKELLQSGSSPTAEALIQKSSLKKLNSGSAPPSLRPKDQLLYLADLLNFQVQFSDFPKRTHKEFLSLVTMSTFPSHVCHGSGATIEDSQDEAALTALTGLSKMSLDTESSTNSTKEINPNAGKGSPNI